MKVTVSYNQPTKLLVSHDVAHVIDKIFFLIFTFSSKEISAKYGFARKGSSSSDSYDERSRGRRRSSSAEYRRKRQGQGDRKDKDGGRFSKKKLEEAAR